MVMLNCSLKELQQIFGKPLLEKELDELLFNLGFELEGVHDDELAISITPDRPDAVSLHGLARVLRAYTGKDTVKTYSAKKSTYRLVIDPSVNSVRPYTVAAVITNLSFTDATIREMIWVQEKLHDTLARGRKKAAIGIYPCEHMHWPIAYRAADPQTIRFQPLESSQIMNGLEILETHPAGKAYAHLLEGKKTFPFFIDAQNQILSMPPIINSHKTGKVTEHTHDIFIECSGFHLQTLQHVLNVLVTLFADMGGEVYSVELSYPDKTIVTPDLSIRKKTLAASRVEEILGVALSIDQIDVLLKRMLYAVGKKNKETIEVFIPPFRSDIWHEMDIIDDIARAYGFNNFKPTMKPVLTIGKELSKHTAKEQLAELFIGCGFQEIFTLALTSREDQYLKMHLSEEAHLNLGQSTEKSLNMIRTWLLPEAMKALMHNRSKEYPQRLFEIEDVVIPDETCDSKAKNITKGCFVIAKTDAAFTDAVQVLTALFDACSTPFDLVETKHGSFIEGRCAAIMVNKANIGVIGEIHPQVITAWGLELPVVGCEFHLDALFRHL
jgi:phenylalanyl-tRNA synthetase beta chain